MPTPKFAAIAIVGLTLAACASGGGTGAMGPTAAGPAPGPRETGGTVIGAGTGALVGAAVAGGGTGSRIAGAAIGGPLYLGLPAVLPDI